jgi:tetratricopeptide (TPR) repeat protein
MKIIMAEMNRIAVRFINPNLKWGRGINPGRMAMKKYLILIVSVIFLVTIAGTANAAEKIEPVKGKNEGIKKENALITKVEAAVKTKNWQEAENISKQLIAINPDRWEYQRTLADAELFLGKYQEAVDAYEKALGLARLNAGGDFKAAKTNIKKAASDLFLWQGNAWLKM